ncbi:MAG: hypothetical protein OZ948_18130 [Deltaproteobacteria bacterium]|nr:hypothetical protein [Deltaproteobacteria bacterium]
MTRVIGRVLTIAFAAVGLAMLSPQVVSADEVGGEEIEVPPRAAAPTPEPVVVTKEVPVSAPPPPFVELERKSVGAGLGLSWGEGTIYWEGQEHAFSVKGLRVGDVGLAKMIGEGHVQNLASLEDFAGTYVAVGAGATAGKGASAVTMRNENGVVISLRSQSEGVALNLGAEGFQVELQ